MCHEMIEREIHMPQPWCSKICTNAMNDLCIERCTLNRDASYFEEKPGLELEDLPPFPIKDIEDMTKPEKLTSVVVYLSKVIDHLQGESYGKDIYNSRGRQVPKDVQKQVVLLGAKKSDPSCKDRTQRSHPRKRFKGVD